ncbi:MAG: hypothetical protein ACRC2B_00095, partial [Rubrivivax sp.]
MHKPVYRSNAPTAPTAGPSLARLKELKRQIIERHVQPDDGRGLVAVLSTLLPIAALLALV